MLDDDHGIAEGGELAAELGEPRRVAGVKADGRLVEDVERADELGAELVGEVDALRLPAGQRAGLAPQREIAQADAQEEADLGAQVARTTQATTSSQPVRGSVSRNPTSSSTVLSPSSAMLEPPTRTASASGRSRRPSQRGHGNGLR